MIFSRNRTAVFRRIRGSTGKQGWGSLQLDEVAYPLIMAYQLKRFDKKTYENHVKKAADFLVKTGPKTTQERWEEKSGYSPSTIAAEIAGLICAADIAKRNGDETSAKLYLKTADDWAANVEKWTATTNGKYGDGNYYVSFDRKRQTRRERENRSQQQRRNRCRKRNSGRGIFGIGAPRNQIARRSANSKIRQSH